MFAKKRDGDYNKRLYVYCTGSVKIITRNGNKSKNHIREYFYNILTKSVIIQQNINTIIDRISVYVLKI
jgi:hypothetical protein